MPTPFPEEPRPRFWLSPCGLRPRGAGLCALGALALAWTSCVTTTTTDTVPKRNPGKAEAIQFVLAATNDWHGELFASPSTPGALPQGGALAFSAQLSALREAFPGRVLWVDAGDMLVEAARAPKRCWVVDVFSLMGLDFATLGERDFGFWEEAEEEKTQAQGALKACMLRARFAWSSANVYSTEDGARPAWLGGDALHMVERQGVQMGFVGLTTPSAPLYIGASNIKGLYFGDMALAAQERAQALRERGAQLVILVVHAGGACAQEGKPSELSACQQQEGELGALLEALPEGLVDMVVAGHTQKPLGGFFKGVPVVQTRGLGTHFSLIEFHWEPTERRLLHEKTRIQTVPICEKTWPSLQSCEGPPPPGEEAEALFWGKQLEVDARLSAMLAPLARQFEAKAQEALGIEVKERLSLGEEEESALGGMWAETLLLATRADVALVHRGAFREALEAGALSAGRLWHSVPYNGRLSLVRFSGGELRRLFQLAFGQTRLRFDVAGVELQLSCLPSGRRQVAVRLMSANGQRRTLEEKAHYWVAMPEFLAQGGAGLEGMVVGAPSRPTQLKGGMRDEALRFWLGRKQALEAPLRPRVLWGNEIDSCKNPETSPEEYPKEQP